MKTIKQLLEDWTQDKNSPFDGPYPQADNGASQGVTKIAHREPGMREGQRYFIKRTVNHHEAHAAALGARVLEHYGLHTNGQQAAHVRLEDERKEQPSLVSEWNEHLVPPPHPVGNRRAFIPKKDMTHDQRVQYAKADVLGTAMGLYDAFNVHGSKGSNIKMHERTGDLHLTDIDEAFGGHGGLHYFKDAENYANNPHLVNVSEKETKNIVPDKALIRRHLVDEHPEAYHQAMSEISAHQSDAGSQAALREHFNTHAPHLSSNHPPGEHAHAVWNLRVHHTMNAFRELLKKPTKKGNRINFGIQNNENR